MMRRRLAAGIVLGAVALLTIAAPALAPFDPAEQHPEYPYAPPARLHIVDTTTGWHLPFVYRVRLVDRLERRYAEDDRARVFLWDALVRPAGCEGCDTIFLMGTDGLGRDVLSRLLIGGRWSLAIAVSATLGALVIGIIVGAIAGMARGIIDDIAMRAAELVLVLPVLYVVLSLRAALPLVLHPLQVFTVLAAALACLGWPSIARGVRSIVAVELTRGYVEAARAAGASRGRLLLKHVLPATYDFLAGQAALLVSGFVVAESTLSFVGFGFADPTPSWGGMLREAGTFTALGEYPWLLAPAGAIVVVSWGLHALGDSESRLAWHS
jgi:peptide/nickel transport system permease protein